MVEDCCVVQLNDRQENAIHTMEYLIPWNLGGLTMDNLRKKHQIIHKFPLMVGVNGRIIY